MNDRSVDGASESNSTGARRLAMPLGLQFSLVELLALILFAGLGAAALRTGGWLAFAFLQVAMWGAVALALSAMAAPARGAWRAFVLGFVLGLASYVGPALYVGESELDPYTARLPLSKTLVPVWNAVHRNIYVDPATGDEFAAEEVTATEPGGGFASGFSGGSFPSGFGGAAGFGGGTVQAPGSSANSVFFVSGMPYPVATYTAADGRAVHPDERPHRQDFMLVAHALLAIAIGYVFGKFAATLHRRRRRRRSDRASEGGTIDPRE